MNRLILLISTAVALGVGSGYALAQRSGFGGSHGGAGGWRSGGSSGWQSGGNHGNWGSGSVGHRGHGGNWNHGGWASTSWRGHGGGWHGGGWHGGHYHGGGWGYPSYYFGFGFAPFYYPWVYAAPSYPVYVEAAPPVYIERPPVYAEPPPPTSVQPPPAPRAPARDAIPTPERLERTTLSATELFEFDRATLRMPQPKLDEIAGVLMRNVQIDNVRIVGYTDRIGTDSYNLRLSQRRAEAVKNYLVSKGVSSTRLTAIGRGKADPVVQCSEKMARPALIKCLEPNRRVVVEPVTVERRVRPSEM